MQPFPHEGGGQPDLLQMLEEEFLSQAKEQGMPLADARRLLLAAGPFIRFGKAYLAEHRPAENFFVDMNHGVRLTNQRAFLISPAADLRGTMQDAGAIGVTDGRSQRGMEGVTKDRDSLRIV